jgi:Zn-dependent protease with chaperone function
MTDLTTATGRYSDGRKAASYKVRVRLEARELVIEPIVQRSEPSAGPGADVLDAPVRWALKGIETGEPLVRGSRDVLVHAPGRTGATLFVADHDFVKAIAKAAPQVTGRAQRWRTLRPLMWLMTSAAALATLVAVVDLSPARTIAGLIPKDARAALGQQVVRSVTAAGRVCETPDGLAALNALAAKLSAASGRDKTFTVTVVDNPAVNAFAAPGEVIVVMRGLLAQAAGPDEVAGILAHEMGHGIELHPEAGLVRGLGLAVVGELILGGTSGGSLANVALVLTNLSYSRGAEREADGHALAILKASAISPEGLAQFFERMAKREGGSEKSKPSSGRLGTGMEIMSSHPSNAERLARVRGAIGYPSQPALSPAGWAALKDICRDEPAGRLPSPKPAAPTKGQRI